MEEWETNTTKCLENNYPKLQAASLNSPRKLFQLELHGHKYDVICKKLMGQKILKNLKVTTWLTMSQSRLLAIDWTFKGL